MKLKFETNIYSIKQRMLSKFSNNILNKILSFCSPISIINIGSINKRFNSICKRMKIIKPIEIRNEQQLYLALKWNFTGYHFIDYHVLTVNINLLIPQRVHRFEFTNSNYNFVSHLIQCDDLVIDNKRFKTNQPELIHGIYRYQQSLINRENSIDQSGFSFIFRHCIINNTFKFDFESCEQMLIDDCAFSRDFLDSIPSSCNLILENLIIDDELLFYLKRFAQQYNLSIVKCQIKDTILSINEYYQDGLFLNIEYMDNISFLYLYYVFEDENPNDFDGIEI